MTFELLVLALGDTPAAHSVGTAPGVRDYFIQLAYLASSVLFILGLKGLTAPDKARRGMQLAALGMLMKASNGAATTT